MLLLLTHCSLMEVKVYCTYIKYCKPSSANFHYLFFFVSFIVLVYLYFISAKARVIILLISKALPNYWTGYFHLYLAWNVQPRKIFIIPQVAVPPVFIDPPVYTTLCISSVHSSRTKSYSMYTIKRFWVSLLHNRNFVVCFVSSCYIRLFQDFKLNQTINIYSLWALHNATDIIRNSRPTYNDK